VGKSSLLNALAGDDIAIVTPIAGTTRDKVVQQIHIDGVPLHIVDTAGLRETDDAVEQIGIARTWQEIERADVILHLLDITQPQEELDSGIAARLPARTPVLKVLNKIDLAGAAAADGGVVPATDAGTAGSAGATLAISARTGDGLDALRKALLDIAGWNPGAESPWLARERHLRALEQAAGHLAMAAAHAEQDDRVLDLFAEELRLAHDSLAAITGKFTSDDLLGEIFSSFCIGK
jgi:tRNA modification GTPase